MYYIRGKVRCGTMEKEIIITELLSTRNLQLIQDSFSDICNVSVSFCDQDGQRVTEPNFIPDFCTEYVNKSALGRKRCEECHERCRQMALTQKKTVVHKCHAGLYGFAAPVFANGSLVGNITGGRVFMGEVDEEKILSYMDELGVDKTGCLEAIRKVRCLDEKELEKITSFIYQMSTIISNMAYDRYCILNAQQEVEHAAKMKSDFLANMSHEIRTPMNAVIGMAEMALRENLPDAAREYVGQIISSGKTLLTIINDILDFSKIDAGMMTIEEEEYDIRTLITDISNIINTRIEEKDIELILDIHPQVPRMIKGDVDRLKQVIINLSNNAVKFTKEGQIVLKIDFVKKSDEDIELFVAVQDTGIGIKNTELVKIFGAFQQVDSKRNRNIEGTGLGLAICKRILELMNGKIWVESQYGKGSLFYFSVPQKIVDSTAYVTLKNKESIKAAGLIGNGFLRSHIEKDMERLEVEYVSINSEKELKMLKEKNIQYLFVGQGMFSREVERFAKDNPDIKVVLLIDFRSEVKSDISNIMVVKKPLYVSNIASIFNGEDIKNSFVYTNIEDFDFIAPNADILIVDDNVINLTVAEGLLKPLRMCIDKATSGKQAVEMVTAKRYDLVFMDHMMPEVDGVETTRIIRRFHPELSDLPIIALTANAVNGTKEMFLEEGMDDFIAKPIEMRNLVSKIRTWLPKEKIQKIAKSTKGIPVTSNEEIVITGLNTKEALRLIGSNKLYWKILRDYYESIDKKSNLIKELEEKEEWGRYTIEVHAVKSASKQIGATKLGELAEKLEKAGNEKDSSYIHKNTDEMLAQYRQYKDILKSHFELTQREVITLKPITSDILAGFFDEIKNAIDELEMDKVEEVIERMSGYQYDGEYKEYFKSLKEKAKEYNADACQEIIKCWEDII